LPLRARVAAALVLLYAQPVTRIVRLTVDDVIDDGATLTVRLGDPPSPLPEPVVRPPRLAERPKVMPRQAPRRVADPTGWCMNTRRNARDNERLPQHSEAHLNWALITMMTRRLTRKSPRTSSWTKKPTR
jgi:hypothetical protein